MSLFTSVELKMTHPKPRRTSVKDLREDPMPIELPAKPPEDHPFQAVRQMVCRRNLRDHTLRLVVYQNPDDEYGESLRRYVTFTGAQFADGDEVWDFVRSVDEEHDVGFCSLIAAPDGRELHVGMVDFAMDPRAPGAGDSFREVTQKVPAWYSFYSSGRSLHGYFTEWLLGSVKQRMAFMGEHLMLNGPARRVVDECWVAGQLISDRPSVLRWTANQPRYLAIPKLWAPPDAEFWR